MSSSLATFPLTVAPQTSLVKWMKRMLELSGFRTDASDDTFTERTAQALKQFQAAQGLPSTGALDTLTFSKLAGVELRPGARRDDYFGEQPLWMDIFFGG